MLDSQIPDILADILEQECRVYKSILRMSIEKTDIIINGRVNELENTVKMEQALVSQLNKLEKDREALVQDFARSAGLNAAGMTVSDIAEHIGGEKRVKLMKLKQTLTTVLGELKNSNETNSRLIRNSLDYINFSINIFASSDIGSNNYGSSGTLNSSKKRSLFDVKL